VVYVQQEAQVRSSISAADVQKYAKKQRKSDDVVGDDGGERERERGGDSRTNLDLHFTFSSRKVQGSLERPAFKPPGGAVNPSCRRAVRPKFDGPLRKKTRHSISNPTCRTPPLSKARHAASTWSGSLHRR